jgi:hypothetical protein
MFLFEGLCEILLVNTPGCSDGYNVFELRL